MPKKTPEPDASKSLAKMSTEELLSVIIDQLKLLNQTQANLQVLERERESRMIGSQETKTNGVPKA